MNRMITKTSILAVLMVISAPLFAGPQESSGSGSLSETRMAAEQGDARAQYNLGVRYYTGNGVPKDHAETAKWFRMAAEQGDFQAQYNLAYLYYHGYGVPQYHTEAVKWYRKAAEQGFIEAQYELGVMYYHGQGVRRNYREAYIWASLAAADGHPSAVETRDMAAERLSRSKLSQAQREAARRHASIKQQCNLNPLPCPAHPI